MGPSSEPSQVCGLPVVFGMCTSISDIGCWPMCFPNPPAPKAAMVPQAYLVCAVEGTQFPGLRAGSGAHRAPLPPPGTVIQSSMWVSFVQWVRLPTMRSGDLECQGPKLN